MIRKILILVALVALALPAAALAQVETYAVDATHSSVEFKVRHLVGKASGRFNEFGGTIVVDRSDLSKSTVELNVKAASIDTDNDDRDGHLKSEDFLAVEEHPEMTFKSTSVEKKSDALFHVTGDFTLRGVTKSITIPVEVLGFGPSPWGKGVAGFETSFEINRKEYGIEWNKALDTGGFILGNEVDITITIEAAMQ
jgi:polyisoprenoid-binding protein YceI